MSYGKNPYSQGGGYGQQRNPFDDRNPYDQRNNPYNQRDEYSDGQAGGYGQGGYDQQGNVEMQSMGDPNAILNECQAIDRAIDQLERRLEQLKKSQRQFNMSNESGLGPMAAEGQEIMGAYRSLVERVRKIKSKKDSKTPRNAPQVGRVDRRLKAAINQYQQVESELRRDVQDQAARQYRIVRPDASEEEVQAAIENPDGGIFQQALMQSGRSAQANQTLNAVRARHDAIQRIERQMVELAQLFQDLDTIVMEQEPLVANIEQQAEQVHDNVVQANEEIGGAIEKARSARRKKWWCLLIVLLIIIIVIVVAVVVVMINKKKNATIGSSSSNTHTMTNKTRSIPAYLLPQFAFRRPTVREYLKSSSHG